MKQIIFLTICFLFVPSNNEELLANDNINVRITPRILGGEDADMGLHSYTLTLRNRGIFFCTAFAISQQDVLATGHCFIPTPYLFPPYPDVTVHSGVNSAIELGIIHRVEKVTVHPNFDSEWQNSGIHDISHILLHEETKLNIDENQRILNLPRQDVQSGAIGTMTGWGSTSLNSPLPAARLQMLRMRMLNYTDCQEFVPRTLYKEQFCAFQRVGHGCGVGDSGGPLVIHNVAIGIHSWCQKNQRGNGLAEIFTNVFQELGFINSVMRIKPSESSSSSSSSSSSPEPDFKGKKRSTRESPDSKKKGWFRRITCTAK